MKISKMAWRNVWRNKRRSLVTIAAMSFALFIMINYLGLAEGYLADMENKILDLELGDIQIFAEGYREHPSIYTRIGNAGELIEKLGEKNIRAAPRLLAAGLAAANESASGVSIRGIEIEADKNVSLVYREPAEGSWLDPGDLKGVVVGRSFVKMMDIKVGDEIMLLSQAADGSMANDLFTIRGILKGVSAGVDKTGVFMNIETLREFMLLPEGYHQLILRLPDGPPAGDPIETVKQIATGLDVKSWRELLPALASMIDSSRAAMGVMSAIIFIAVGILILNAMLMAVFERIRELGILKALGFGPVSVFLMVIIESTIMLGISIFIGTLLSLPMIWYLSTTGIDVGVLGGISIGGIAWSSIWRAEINRNIFISPITTLVFIVSAAVIYPALKAAFINPIKAIYHR